MNAFTSKVLRCGAQTKGHAPASIAVASALANSKRILAGTVTILAATLTGPVWAGSLDCAKHLQAAEAAIDKVAEDMKGMEMMAKSQLADVDALLNVARKFATDSHHDCDQPRADLDRARGIAQADAAKGYAIAADMLHWQYMKPMTGSSSMTGMQHGASSGNTAMPVAHDHSAHAHTMSASSDTNKPMVHDHAAHAHGTSMGK
ncbi:MAG: hypothetical protein JJE42_13580 [Burkholderiales bacterium]|nr:hypothetical protein [Burkholderiales bacterium]